VSKRWIGIGSLGLWAWIVACGGGPEPPESPEPPEGFPSRPFHWSPVTGAADYRVRAWAGHRLLFEEDVRDTTLAPSRGMARAVAAFDTVRLEILARDAGGATLTRRERAWKP